MLELNFSSPTFRRFAPSALTILLAITAVLLLLALSSQAPAYADRYADCNQSADADRTIVGCSQMINRGKRERRRKRSKAYNNRGLAYYNKGQYDRAIADYTKAIQINPKRASAYNRRGVAYAKKGQYDRAIADYTKAIQINPNYAKAYNNRGLNYSKKGHYDRSIADYTKVIQINPNYTGAYDNRGFAYAKKGEHDRAIDDYTKAIQINPNYAGAYDNRGVAYYRKGQHDRAIADYTKAIQINPKRASAYDNRGLAYSKKGQHDRAIADCTKAIQINPKRASAYNNRGLAYERKGQHDRAIADYTKAIQINPSYALAYDNRGLVYANKGQYDRAIADYTKAIQINPNYAFAYNDRGVAYAKKGQYDRAIDDYTKALSINPSLAEARTKLNALEGKIASRSNSPFEFINKLEGSRTRDPKDGARILSGTWKKLSQASFISKISKMTVRDAIRPYKVMVTFLIKAPLLKAELAEISNAVRGSAGSGFALYFVDFEMVGGAHRGSWATAHHRPKLDVEIFGLSAEKYAKLQSLIASYNPKYKFTGTPQTLQVVSGEPACKDIRTFYAWATAIDMGDRSQHLPTEPECVDIPAHAKVKFAGKTTTLKMFHKTTVMKLIVFEGTSRWTTADDLQEVAAKPSLSKEARYLIRKMKTMYDEMNRVRYMPAFHACMFAACSPIKPTFLETYNRVWSDDDKYMPTYRELMGKGAAVTAADIWVMAKDYANTQGRGNDFTRQRDRELRILFKEF